jgi:hypothetical protein
MHYVTRRYKQMQKHKFGIMYLDTLFIESIPVSPEHEKYCDDVSRHECTRMHYLTCRSHRMEKHKFSITGPVALFMETALGNQSMKNSKSMFRAQTNRMNYITRRSHVMHQRNVSRCTFYRICTGPTLA